jgi:CBS domain containing-hemolysin-like protein
VTLAWLVVIAMVGANALYVAAEFALVAVPRRLVAERARGGSSRARELKALLDDGVARDRAVAACQVGITLSSLLVGAFGQATLGVALAGFLQGQGLDAATAISASAVAVLIGLTVVQVVLGELLPKSIALQFPLETALWVVMPLRISTTLFRPLISVLNGSALLMLRPFGIAPGGHEHVHTSAEIELLLGESQRAGALSPEAHRQLQRGLSLSKRTARQLMVPRVDMLAVEVSTPIAEVLKELLASPYSRLPVYDGTLDHVLGTVSAKDITALYARQQPIPPLRQLLRPIPFVPDLLPAEKLIRVMQDEKSSKAIVVDEFGGVQGIISVEDVLGELFGDIADELKEYDGTDIEQLPDGRKKLLGSMPLIDAEPFLGVRWAGEAATLGGHITGLLGRLPAAGERFVIDGVEVTIIERTPSAIKAVAIKPRPDREASA